MSTASSGTTSKIPSIGTIKATADMVLVVLVALTLLFSLLFRDSEVVSFALVALTFIGIIPVVISALRALLKRQLTIDLLASIALIFSLLAREWFSAAFITLMLASARLFDQWTEAKTKDIISHLLKYRPNKLKILSGDEIKEISLASVKIGDMVIVESGERIPVDGVVIKGDAAVNQASLTGES